MRQYLPPEELENSRAYSSLFGINIEIHQLTKGEAMKRKNQFLICILILTAFASSSFAKTNVDSKNREPSSVSTWKHELEAFKTRKFTNLQELKKTSTEFQNKLMDDEGMRFEEKVAIRKQIYKLESQKSADFPEPKIVGFKKVPVDPADPGQGYVLEPMFK